MDAKIWGRQYQSMVICVDSYDGGIPSGFITNPCLREPKPFHGTMQFLKAMERMLDDMECAEAHTFKTQYDAAAVGVSVPEADRIRGKAATFAVQVIFRQNASWQGTVTWAERGKTTSFRSVLELIMLMDSALCGSQETTGGEQSR